MDGYVRIGIQVDTKDFDAEIKYIESQLDEIEHKLKQADMGFEVGDTQKLEAQYSKLIKQLDRLQKKQADLNKTDLTEIQKNIDKVGNSVSKTISKVGKWALAVFGVRSAYMFVRQSASTLAQYNEQIASDLEYMQFALASMLQPVIEGLINLAYKLLTYVNYIAKAWFGVNLFANASADAMNKGAKSAEKMKKSLAGFDEMNVLNDNGTTGALGAMPSFDLTSMQDIPIPSWIQWIAENKDIVIAGLLGIAGGLTAVNFGLTAIQGLGIGLILLGIVLLIQDIIDFIKDPSWENFIAILSDIAIVIGGVMLVMGNWWGLLVSIIGLLVKLVAENWDKIKEILGKVGDWIYDNIINPVGDFFGKMWEGILKGAEFVGKGIKGVFSGFAKFFIRIFETAWNGVKTLFSKSGQIFNGLKDGIVNVFKTIVNLIIDGINRVIRIPFDAINGLLNTIRNTSFLGISPFKGLWKENPLYVPQIPKLAVGGIVNMPGRGVPIGGAITGEAGREGVIPLTDSQAMEELGATIGKYITINANITNTINGRVISRELQKINNDSDFATNS